MTEFTTVKHKIQLSIIDYLLYHHTARFKELRPPKVDTNLFTYHLKRVVASGLVEKTDKGYTLGVRGLAHLGRAQTTIRLCFVVQNGDGDILLQKRTRQPYIDSWTLPHGTVQDEDVSVLAAAQRHVRDKLGLQVQALEHAGDCYIRVQSEGMPITTDFTHVIRFYSDDIQTSDTLQWARPHKLSQLKLAPAVEDIMTRTFFKDPFFFEEFHAEW